MNLYKVQTSMAQGVKLDVHELDMLHVRGRNKGSAGHLGGGASRLTFFTEIRLMIVIIYTR